MALALSSAAAYAQVPSQIRATNTLEGLSDGGIGTFEQLVSLPLPPNEVKGDTYESTDWKKCKIYLAKSQKVVEVFGARYDIQSNQLEVRRTNAGEVFAVAATNINAFTFIEDGAERTFINAKRYKQDGVEASGFFEVLADGQMPLLKLTTVYLKQPTYKKELGMGERDAQIVKSKKYFTARDKDLVPVNLKNKKKFVGLFADRAGDVSAFMEQNAIQPSRENEAAAVFNYINSAGK